MPAPTLLPEQNRYKGGFQPLPEHDPDPTAAKTIFEGLIDLLTGAVGVGEPTRMNTLGELAPMALGMAVKRRTPFFSKAGGWKNPASAGAGERIPAGSQSMTTTPAGKFKVPRFRSDQGMFIEHEGKWWRLRPSEPDSQTMTIDWMGNAEEAAKHPGKVLKSKTLPAKDLVETAQKGNAFNKGTKGTSKVARRKK